MPLFDESVITIGVSKKTSTAASEDLNSNLNVCPSGLEDVCFILSSVYGYSYLST